MEQIICFAGPSRPAGEFANIQFHPSARLGDIEKEALAHPGTTILLADTTFFQHPGPTHLELARSLKTLKILGCSSAGALRAVELLSLGMAGIGRVFEAFKEGALCDDSELFVMMDSRNERAVTVPLVNVRRMIKIALGDGLDRASASRLFASLKGCYWADRSRAFVQSAIAQHLGNKAHIVTKIMDSKEADVKSADCEAALLFLSNRISKPSFVESDKVFFL